MHRYFPPPVTPHHINQLRLRLNMLNRRDRPTRTCNNNIIINIDTNRTAMSFALLNTAHQSHPSYVLRSLNVHLPLFSLFNKCCPSRRVRGVSRFGRTPVLI